MLNSGKNTMSLSKTLRELEQSIHPVLLQKWRQVFKFNDVDNDNIWTKKDMEILEANVMNNPDMPQAKRERCTHLIHDLWVKHTGPDNNSVTYEQWLPRINRVYENGQLEEIVKQYRIHMFDCIDLDDDGKIDYREFKIFYAGGGRSEVPYMDQAFRAIDTNKDGLISLEEYIEAHVKYYCDTTVKLDDLPIFGLPKTPVNSC